ncbi:uncharacterized protein LOC143223302 isoform X2 [Tachypleus tridentatus]|uniref:uncharacterized protein LOC143223302 isoform X2 n=1 Tax=Tachypleus tridentatus TaxID=6853 RepID=UPI003FD21320
MQIMSDMAGDIKDQEVNVLDEILENADDDDLTAELNNEEKNSGIKKLTPTKPLTSSRKLQSKTSKSITKPPAKSTSGADLRSKSQKTAQSAPRKVAPKSTGSQSTTQTKVTVKQANSKPVTRQTRSASTLQQGEKATKTVIEKPLALSQKPPNSSQKPSGQKPVNSSQKPSGQKLVNSSQKLSGQRLVNSSQKPSGQKSVNSSQKPSGQKSVNSSQKPSTTSQAKTAKPSISRTSKPSLPGTSKSSLTETSKPTPKEPEKKDIQPVKKMVSSLKKSPMVSKPTAPDGPTIKKTITRTVKKPVEKNVEKKTALPLKQESRTVTLKEPKHEAKSQEKENALVVKVNTHAAAEITEVTPKKEEAEVDADIDNLNVTVNSDELNEDMREEQNDTYQPVSHDSSANKEEVEPNSEDSRSECCSCEDHDDDDQSSVITSSDSESGSGAHSHSESEFEDVEENKCDIAKEKRSRTRKRTHSPIVYEQKEDEGLRSPKRGRVSSSVNKKDYSHLVKYFFRDARFFLIKSNNIENVVLSKAKGVWSTPPQNESKLNQAFKESKNVLLIFSVKGSGKFQGFARLAGTSRHDGPSIQWVLPPGLSARALGGVFQVDWICRHELPFTKTQHLYNPWNDGKQVKIGRDGQEIEPRVAEELCRLFPVDEHIDLSGPLRRMKHTRPHSSRTSRDAYHRDRRYERRDYSSSSRRSPHDPMRPPVMFQRRRRKYREGFDHRGPRPNLKYLRRDIREDNIFVPGFMKDTRKERSSVDRYGMRRDIFMNGGFLDYMREYHPQRPPMPPMPFGAAPPFPVDPVAFYDRSLHPPDYGPSRGRGVDKRAYERSVDDFLRRTARPPSRGDRRYRDRR